MVYSYKGIDPFSSHIKIAKYISEYKKNTIVLDVGCNEGFIGRALRDIKWKGEIVGLDKEKIFERKIRKNGYNSFLKIDVEKNFTNIRKKFDVVVFADVLEHLIDPHAVLLRTRKILKKDGLIIISLPNIANSYVRINLMLGNFNYSDRGILDKDHKFFYTNKTAHDLIIRSRFKILKKDITPLPLPVVNKNFAKGGPLFPFYALLHFISKARPHFFAYQLIFICETA